MAGYRGADLSGGKIVIYQDDKVVTISGKTNVDKIMDDQTLKAEVEKQTGKTVKTPLFFHKLIDGNLCIRSGENTGEWPDEVGK